MNGQPQRGQNPRPQMSDGHTREIKISPVSRAQRPSQNTSRTVTNAPTRRIPRAVPAQPASKKSAKKSGLHISDRNLLLLAILFFAVIVTVIIFGIRSCTAEPETKNNTSPKARDTVNVRSETAPPADEDTSPAFAEYTDDSTELIMDSKYGILIDLENNRVIASKNAEAKIYPASMTKIMTLIVAYENAKSLDDKYTFTAELIDPLYAENASQAGFEPGESVPIRDMLYGCILPSGADATLGLADYIAGSEEKFAVLMNDKAAELGLKNTHFVTASGLHDNNHYSTCHEMAIILKYAISDPYMREVLSTYQYTTSPTPEHPKGIELTSTLKQRMAGDEAEGIFVQGGKTGFTNEALNCLATYAAHCTEDMAAYVEPEYILVTAYASGEYSPIFDAIDIYKKYCNK